MSEQMWRNCTCYAKYHNDMSFEDRRFYKTLINEKMKIDVFYDEMRKSKNPRDFYIKSMNKIDSRDVIQHYNIKLYRVCLYNQKYKFCEWIIKYQKEIGMYHVFDFVKEPDFRTMLFNRLYNGCLMLYELDREYLLKTCDSLLHFDQRMAMIKLKNIAFYMFIDLCDKENPLFDMNVLDMELRSYLFDKDETINKRYIVGQF